VLPLGIASLIVAMGACWIVTPAIIALGRRLDAVDRPGARKIHAQPIPRIGGLAVFIGFVAGLAFAAWATGRLWHVPHVNVYWRGLAIAAAGVLVTGLIDDLRGLSFVWKFVAQTAAAAYAWSCGFRVESISMFGADVHLGALSLPLTVLWIVGITNAVNLIDGLDGLAAGTALITTSTVAVIALVRDELGVSAASVALAGSLIGFLAHNFNPARIFLGDSGSMFLGFVLAVTSVRGAQKGPTAVAILVPLLVLALPLLDTSVAVVRRLYRLGTEGVRTGNAPAYVVRNIRNVFLPDRAHIHHRLLDLGLSHRRTVAVLYGVGVVCAATALALVVLRSAAIGAVLVTVLVVMLAGLLAVLYAGAFRRLARRGAPHDGEGVSERPLAASQSHGS
jgi:UDP-GlcNAc:undecaprenyl-phosphate GlcNAc-1-phosphate transferase